MRCTRGAGDLVARAHAVGDHERQDRRGVIFKQQHSQIICWHAVFRNAANVLDECEAVDDRLRRMNGGGDDGCD